MTDNKWISMFCSSNNNRFVSKFLADRCIMNALTSDAHPDDRLLKDQRIASLQAIGSCLTPAAVESTNWLMEASKKDVTES